MTSDEVHVFCCVNERRADDPRGCCAGKGSLRLCELMAGYAVAKGMARVRVHRSGCLDLCEYGPVVVIAPPGVWYRCTGPEDIDEIFVRQIGRGERVARLLLYSSPTAAR